MKIAIAQVSSSPNKAENLIKAEEYIIKAKKNDADIVCFPESFMLTLPPESKINYADVSEPLNGPFLASVSDYARQNNIYVICGVYEQDKNEKRRAYNTTVLIDRNGEIIHSYRKTHLYDAFSYRESDFVIPGDKPAEVFDTEFGNLGLMVCYELRFPEVSRRLAINGANILIIPTAWFSGPLKEEQFEILVRARAIENTVFICACNKTGQGFTGRSMIVDPVGNVLSQAGIEEAILFAEIDSSEIERVREINPSILQRRTELY